MFPSSQKSSKIVFMGKLPPYERPSIDQHNRQRFWQIIFPIVLFSLLIIIVSGFTIFAGAVSDRLWADISIIWLVIPVLMFSLVIIAILAGLIYLMTRLTKVTPNFTRRVQNLFSRLEKGTRKIADSSVQPILWVEQFKYSMRKFLNTVGLGKK
jgi:hypothetical protein